MFEQELEMEQRQSSVVPLLLIVAMIMAFVGVAGYYVVQNRKVLPAAEASSLIASSLKQDGPITFQFKVGPVIGSVQDRPHDANYRLLEKAGLITIGKDKGRITPITMTAAGAKLFAEIPGVTQTKDPKDATTVLCSAGRSENAGRNADRDDDRDGPRHSRVHLGMGPEQNGRDAGRLRAC